MKIEMIDIDKIKPYEKNPRKNQNGEKIAKSLEKYGWRQPIVVDKDYVVIVGHTRLMGAEHLKMKQVPVHVATDMKEDEVKAYRIADNRLSEDSTWDYELLKFEMDLLNDIGFDLDDLGFEKQELETIVFQPDHNSREWLDTEEHWQDMPSFEHDDQSPYKSINVNFVSKESMDKFFQIIKQDYTDKTKFIWYPKIEKNVIKDKAWEND